MRIKIREADRLYSLWLRKERKYICERCKRFYPDGKGLQVSHYFGRAAESVRFTPENTDCLCFICHQHFEQNPNEYREWKVKQLGIGGLKMLTAWWAIPQKRDDAKVLLFLKNQTTSK